MILLFLNWTRRPPRINDSQFFSLCCSHLMKWLCSFQHQWQCAIVIRKPNNGSRSFSQPITPLVQRKSYLNSKQQFTQQTHLQILRLTTHFSIINPNPGLILIGDSLIFRFERFLGFLFLKLCNCLSNPGCLQFSKLKLPK